MRTPLGKLLSTKSSAATTGWGTSIAVHAVGAVVAMMVSVSGSVERPTLLETFTPVELVASLDEPEVPVPILPHDVPRIDDYVIDTRALAPFERELPPVDVDVCRADTEPPATAEPVPAPTPVAPKREPAVVHEEPVVAASTPPISRRPTATSTPDTRACLCALPKKLDGNPAPPYPADALARRQQGEVLLEVHVDAYGLVEEISIAKSSGSESLDRAALETVRSWLFRPAREGGKPIPMVVTVPVRFAIQRR
jgi:protein TonB